MELDMNKSWKCYAIPKPCSLMGKLESACHIITYWINCLHSWSLAYLEFSVPPWRFLLQHCIRKTHRQLRVFISERVFQLTCLKQVDSTGPGITSAPSFGRHGL
jgi:hypothetical protein